MLVTSMRSAVFVLPLLALYSASLRGPAGAVADPSAGFVADFGCAGARGTADVKELFLLNGEVVNRDRFESVPKSEVGIVEVICWSKSKQLFDVDVNLGVASMWTNPTPLDFIEDAFAEIARQQEAHRSNYGIYAASLSALRGFEAQDGIAIELSSDALSWSGTARHNRVNHVCSIGHEYDGGRPPAHGPVCRSEHVH